MRIALVALGWLYAALIVWLSLTPSPPDPGFDYGDKVGHLAAYAILMAWFAYLYRRTPVRLAYALLWIALGIGLEFAQGASGYRHFELADMAANSLGVLLGWGLSATLRR
jgi:VanZ family protein